MNNRFCKHFLRFSFLLFLLPFGTSFAQNPSDSQKPTFPWMDRTLSPDDRASMVLSRMTLDEKIALLHGNGMAHASQWQMPLTYLSNGGAGYVEGGKPLGVPPPLP